MKLKLILDDEDENIGLKSEKLKDSLNDSKPKLRLLTNEECYLEDSNQDESYLMEEKDEYLLEETNEYKIEDLKKDIEKNNKDTLAKIFFIDKLGDSKDLNKVEAELDNLKITEEEINYIASYINKIIGKEYGKETSNQMIEILKKRLSKEEVKDMLLENFVKTCFEEGIKKGETRGETRGISKVAINMLKKKCKKDLIKQCTGLSDAKIKELEKSLQSA